MTAHRAKTLAAALFGLLLALCCMPAAWAHATLVASTPAQGAILVAPPDMLTLRFDEPVALQSLQLVAPDGAITPLTDKVASTGAGLSAPPPDDAAEGSYALSYRVVSADGHPVAGTIVFSIGAPTDAVAPALIDPILPPAIWLAKTLSYLGLFFGIGTAFFAAWVARRPSPVRSILLVGLLATVASLGLQGLDMLGLTLADLADIKPWQASLGTSFGPAGLVVLAGLALALLATVLPRAARPLTLAALVAAAASLAMTGHAGTAEPQALTRSAVFIHALAIGFWAGALWPLFQALRRPDGAPVLARFSRIIPVAIAPLILAGAILAWIQVGDPQALWQTAYGQVLLAKLALLGAVFSLAIVNRWRLTRPALAGQPQATRRLRRAILAEILLLLAVFGIVALWRFTPPPRILAEAERQMTASVHLHGAEAMAQVALSPGRAGAGRAEIYLFDPDFSPLSAQGVTLTLSNAPAGIEPLRYRAVETEGVWHVDDLTLPLAGTWSVRLDLRVSDFEQVTLKGEIDIAP